jgi:hypothetical protein
MSASVLSRFVVFQPIAWCNLAEGLVRDRRFAGAIIAVALAATAASSAWAAGSQDKAHPQQKTAAAPDLNADGSVPNVITKTGVKTRVAVAYDCDQPNQAPILWARADHGTIDVGTGTGPQCGHPSMSLTGVFYTSEPGFKGTDKVYVLGFITNGNINATYTVLVK